MACGDERGARLLFFGTNTRIVCPRETRQGLGDRHFDILFELPKAHEPLTPILNERVPLTVGPERHRAAQVIHGLEVFKPEHVYNLQEEPPHLWNKIVSEFVFLRLKRDAARVAISQKRQNKFFYFRIATEERGAAPRVDGEALRVHHIVIGENLFARIKVESLNAPLRGL